MTTFNAVQGDQDTITVQLDGIVDLDAVNGVTAHVTHRTSGTTATLDGDVDDSDACTITIDLATDDWLDTAEAGEWWIEFELTFSSGQTPKTWPVRGPDVLNVRAQLDTT